MQIQNLTYFRSINKHPKNPIWKLFLPNLIQFSLLYWCILNLINSTLFLVQLMLLVSIPTTCACKMLLQRFKHELYRVYQGLDIFTMIHRSIIVVCHGLNMSWGEKTNFEIENERVAARSYGSNQVQKFTGRGQGSGTS